MATTSFSIDKKTNITQNTPVINPKSPIRELNEQILRKKKLVYI